MNKELSKKNSSSSLKSKSKSKEKKSNSSSKSNVKINNNNKEPENIILTKSSSKILQNNFSNQNKIIDVNKTINFNNNETANLKLNLIPNENNFISTFQSTPSMLLSKNNQNEFPLCEGCNKNYSNFFCNSCRKLFCKNCDENLHKIASYTKHSKILLSNLVSIGNNFCFHHKNQFLLFFCESCQEVICIECKLNGPHNDDNLHFVQSLDDNFNKKIMKINEKIKIINEKNDEIEEKKEKFENIKIDVKNKANDIINLINNEMNEYLNKNENIEGQKYSILNLFSNNFQKKIFDIEKILNALKIDNNNDKNNKNEIDFLLNFKNFENSLKTILIEEDFLNDENIKNITNFPSDFNEEEKKIKNYDKNQILLKIKNDIIWKLLKTEYEIPEIKEIEKETEEKKTALKMKKEKMESQLNDFKLYCVFCGELLNLNNINEKCEINNDEEGFVNRNFTKDFPPVNLLGNFRHFFSFASGSYREFLKSGGKKENFNPNAKKIIMNKKKIIIKKEKKKEEKKEEKKDDIVDYQKIVIKNKKMDQSHYVEKPLTNEWVIKIAKAIETDDINFYNLLVTFDDDNDNFISLDDVLKALKKIRVFISQKDKKSMQKYIELSKYEKNGINIQKFTANFMRPKDFEEINNKKKIKIKQINKKIKDNI